MLSAVFVNPKSFSRSPEDVVADAPSESVDAVASSVVEVGCVSSSKVFVVIEEGVVKGRVGVTRELVEVPKPKSPNPKSFDVDANGVVVGDKPSFESNPPVGKLKLVVGEGSVPPKPSVVVGSDS